MSTSPRIPEAQCQRLKEELFLSRPGTPVQGTSLSLLLSPSSQWEEIPQLPLLLLPLVTLVCHSRRATCRHRRRRQEGKRVSHTLEEAEVGG